jgi:steroid 5-alpha reductase family enzyme
MSDPVATLVFGLGCSVLLWLVSLRLRDVSIIDIFWGPGIALMVDLHAWLAGAAGMRAWLAIFLVNLWGLRLAAHIGARHHGEDHRYGAMRKKFGPRWWWWSFFQVFLLQIILIWFLPAPLVAAVRSGALPLTWLDFAGAALAVTGLVFETVADWQLARFQRDPANKGQVMDRGLWGLSRHPNYFGEAVMWWGFFLIGFAGSGAWWIMLSPAIITLLLLKVSGVTLMEDGIAERRPAYAAYKQRVSAFVPWPPKKA